MNSGGVHRWDCSCRSKAVPAFLARMGVFKAFGATWIGTVSIKDMRRATRELAAGH